MPGARRASSMVAEPVPAPSSKMCSPNCESRSIHGNNCLRVRYRQSADPQYHFSKEFICGQNTSKLIHFSLMRRLLPLKHGADPAERRCELVGVIGRGILELLEEAIDGGANFGGIGWLGITAIGNVERIHGHGGLF